MLVTVLRYQTSPPYSSDNITMSHYLSDKPGGDIINDISGLS